jgi:DNA polymerase
MKEIEMRRLWLDFETRSMLNIKQCGLDRYAKDPETGVLMLAWAFDEEEPRLWLPCLGEPMPAELFAGLTDPTVLKCAWNFNFEKDILHFKLGIAIPLIEWYDPNVLCAYMSLPIGLDRAGNALNIDEKKIHTVGDKKGIKIFSQPTKQMKRVLKKFPDAPVFYFKDWNSHPEEWKQFCDYCKQDVVAERGVWHAAVEFKSPITPGEHQAWLLDQRMNDNGVWIDLDYVQHAKALALGEVEKIMNQMKAATGLENPNSRDQMLGWLTERGYPFDSLDVEHVEEALKLKFLKPLVREMLELKQKIGGSAYTKLQKIEDMVGADQRLRDQFIYHGAHTGRWAGRGVQLQNLYKPDREVSKCTAALTAAIRSGTLDIPTIISDYNTGVDLWNLGHPTEKPQQHLVSDVFTVMEVVASTIRGAFAAAPGNKLVVGDLAQIESRVLAALAQCQLMISAYADGRDLYKEVMASQLGIPLSEVTKAHRDRGKVIILGCGYGMGWEKFIEYALTYGIVLSEKEAKEAVYGFRDTYKEIVSFWGELNAATLTAFKAGICVYVKGLVVDGRDENCLKIKLPSGRYIHYHRPRLVNEPPPWGGPPKEGIHFIMYGSKGAKDNRLYGGLLTENVVQAVARDLLLNGMIEAEKMGFKIIMTIHDEIAGEVPITSPLGEKELLAAMCVVPEWGEGMGFVLKAEGYENAFYKK